MMNTTDRVRFQELQEALPYGWSFIAHREGTPPNRSPWRFSAFSAKRGLSTGYHEDIDALADAAWELDMARLDPEERPEPAPDPRDGDSPQLNLFAHA